MSVVQNLHVRRLPDAAALLELIKPVTWFPPMWAFACGAVSSGAPAGGNWLLILAGIFLAGPMVCGMSQAINDWCDRHVDKINEPQRPIPSGRVPGRWGLWVAIIMSVAGLALGAALGPWGLTATIVAIICAWAYSAEPVRLKKSGWWGPGMVAFCYEGLPWLTGAAVLSNAAPSAGIILIALLYALGAHGIMTLNDFKALAGDKAMGIRSLPVILGPVRAARIACVAMTVPQVLVIAALAHWERPWHAAGIALVLALQIAAMRVLLTNPKAKAPWYNGTGIVLYVTGMMIAAFALRSMGTAL